MVGSFLQKKMMKTNDLERQEVIRRQHGYIVCSIYYFDLFCGRLHSWKLEIIRRCHGRNLYNMRADFFHHFSRHHHNWKL